MPGSRLTEQLEGINPVREALRAGRPIRRLWVARGAGGLQELLELARARGIPVLELERPALEQRARSRAPQGVIAEAEPLPEQEAEDCLARAAARREDPLLVALDGLEDPQNLGAILRSAEAAGAHGVLVPRNRAVGLTPSAVKASAGAVEYVPVVRVTNLVRTLEDLKKQGLWIAGADAGAPAVCWEQDLRGPLVLVIGSEGRGLARLTREHCDFLVRLPMAGRLNSLNAAAAAAALLYEIMRQRAGGRTGGR